MDKVLLKLDLEEHKGQERIFVFCEYNSSISKILKQIPGAKFSVTRRSWHFPPVRELVEILKDKTKDLVEINVQALRPRLVAKQQLPALVQSHILNQI